MKEKFLDNSISLISKYQKVDEGDISKLRYGLEALYITYTKIGFVFLTAAILGIFKEILLLLILFNIIRFTGFGFHASKSSQCLVGSIISFVLLPYLLLKLNLNKDMILILGIFSIIYLFFYAPADTQKRPLPNKRKRIIRKAITVFTACVFTTVAYILNNYNISIILISAALIESIMVSPITYKISGQSYRNYLNYNKA